jgi:hypothetical protein
MFPGGKLEWEEQSKREADYVDILEAYIDIVNDVEEEGGECSARNFVQTFIRYNVIRARGRQAQVQWLQKAMAKVSAIVMT